MLTLHFDAEELFNSQTGEFVAGKEETLELEHSLISISKWEAKWKRPFLSKGPANTEEVIDYVRCMTIGRAPDPLIYTRIRESHIKEIVKYIDDSMTATWFNDRKGRPRRRSNSVMTSEVIYWQMITLGVPFECQKWHLNRLLTLIRVCDEKEQPPKKMGQNDILKQNYAANAKRRARRH